MNPIRENLTDAKSRRDALPTMKRRRISAKMPSTASPYHSEIQRAWSRESAARLHRAGLLATVVLFFSWCGNVLGAVHYVDAKGTNPSAPYATWATAATNIQDAIDAAAAGDQILVTNGIYNTGSNSAAGGQITARVSVYKPLALASVNGAGATVIDGGGAVRCVFLTNGASLSGFTLTNGNTMDSSPGGGVWCESGVILSNCVISGCTNSNGGGGCSGGTLYNCILRGNATSGAGGGCLNSTAYHCVLENNLGAGNGGGASGGAYYSCTFTGNSGPVPGYAQGGGGAENATLYNCLLTGNTAGAGGGAYLCRLYNCTLTGNYPNAADGYVYTFMGAYFNPSYAYNCILYSNSTAAAALCVLDHCCASDTNFGPWEQDTLSPITDCITNDPQFVDAANGDYRLQSTSPCIGAGAVQWAATPTDFAGSLRIVNGAVDMGAYEYQKIPAPYLALQPPGGTLVAGANYDLTVVAGGTAPLAYQWSFNGQAVPGATNATLPLPDIQAAESGNYQVAVTNSYGATESAVAVLNVTNPLPPRITVQPSDQVSDAGGPVSFSVAVSGTGPLSYQWRLNGTNLPNYLSSTVAGNGEAAFAGDYGAATNASLNSPAGLAFDSGSNLYIADQGNNRVRKVSPNGIITTVAGTGAATYSGEGGAATNASLNPCALAVGANGDLFVVDQAGGGVRRIDMNGIITTVAEGFNNPISITVDSAGNLILAVEGENQVFELATNSANTTVAGSGALFESYYLGFQTIPYGFFAGDGWWATNAALNSPCAVAVDADRNIFISDFRNYRVRRVNSQGIIDTVAGNGTLGFPGNGVTAVNASLSPPTGICLDAWGEIYLADMYDNLIWKLDPRGVISILAGAGGLAINTGLNGPNAVALDWQGNLFISDFYNNRIRKISIQGPVLTLASIGATNAGDYDVVVTNAYGSVTSSIASLTVTWPAPVIYNFSAAGGKVTFVWSTVSGQSYQVQYAADLAADDWTNLGAPMTATSASLEITDAIGTNPRRFYRVALLH